MFVIFMDKKNSYGWKKYPIDDSIKDLGVN